ncbi:MAG: DUF2157 domain-containing protein [bacterium]
MGLFDSRWKEWFREQISSWEEEEIISSDQADTLRSRYGDDIGPESLIGQNQLITIVGILGALLIGTGIILFVASNWQNIGPSLKVSLIILTMMIFYGLGYSLRFESTNYPKTGSTFLFLGHLTFGSAIWLISQIFHLSSHYPNGFLYWLIGVLAMSAGLQLWSGLILSSILLCSWIGMEITSLVEFTEPEMITGIDIVLSVPVLLFPLLFGWLTWNIYQSKTRTGLFITLFSSGGWICYVLFRGTPQDIEQYVPVASIYILFATLLYWLGDLQASWSESGSLFRWVSLLYWFPVIYGLSFEDGAEGFLDHTLVFYPVHVAIYIALLIGISIVGFLLFRQFDRREQYNFFIETSAVVLLFSIVLLGAFGVTSVIYPYVIATNIIGFSLCLGYIAKGYVKQETSVVIAGLLSFSVMLLTRYFDMAWDLLPRSFFFIAGGTVLLVVCFLFEFFRRRLVHRMEEQSS